MATSDADGIDLTQFYGVFFDEAAEHLARMEELLLAIDLSAADEEDLNAIFRAAHSIKGGAATFGFRDVTGLTHDMETVFDKVRKGEMALSTELVNTFLESGDALNALLAHHRGVGPALPQSDVEDLQARLRGFLERPAATGAAPVAEMAVAQPAARELELVFGPFDTGFAARHVDETLRDLADFGKISDAPAGSQPEGYRAVRIVTEVSAQDMQDTLAFMIDPDKVRVVALAAAEPAEAPMSLPAAAAVPDSGAPAGADIVVPAVSVAEAEAPVVAAAPAGTDDGFGLFVDAATLPARQAPPAAASNVAALHGNKPHAGGDAASIRVSVEKVDQLINLVGELVITQAMLAQTASESDPVLYERLHNGLAQLERNTRDLQEAAMSIRMLPMSFVFSRFPRVVRDTAAKLGKEVELHTIGEGTELDKGLIERIVDPLTHLVRNSLDHGLEMPDDREAAGKTRKGIITLRAYHQGGAIVIEVADDGRGLSRDKILAKARERGMQVAADVSDQEVWQLIFEAGFSTAEKVTDVSGRGVGMDVVRRNILDMGGRVEIETATGIGTRITIRLPLTLAILDGMSVRVGDEVFIIPLGYIRESLQPTPEAIRALHGQRHVVAVRGDYLPVVSLAKAFGIHSEVNRYEHGILVILEAEGGKTALFVDDLVGQHQVVIKSLETNYRKVAGLSGATIMGDGRVAMILDAAWLVGLANSHLDKAA